MAEYRTISEMEEKKMKGACDEFAEALESARDQLWDQLANKWKLDDKGAAMVMGSQFLAAGVGGLLYACVPDELYTKEDYNDTTKRVTMFLANEVHWLQGPRPGATRWERLKWRLRFAFRRKQNSPKVGDKVS
jgi:hypothetical protein